MQRLRAPQWRRQHTRNGPHLVLPADAAALYESYLEALAVVGQGEIADALRARLTLSVVDEFPGALIVLKQLAREPLVLPASGATWDEIVEDAPLHGDHWDELGELDKSDELDELDKFDELDELDALDKLGQRIKSGSTGSIDGEPSDDSAEWAQEPRTPQLLEDTVLLPAPVARRETTSLTDAEIVREVKLALLGYKSLLSSAGTAYTSKNLSTAAFYGLLSGLATVVKTLSFLRSVARDNPRGFTLLPLLREADEAILSWDCTTLLQVWRNSVVLVRPFAGLDRMPRDAVLEWVAKRTRYTRVFRSMLAPVIGHLQEFLGGDAKSPIVWGSRGPLCEPVNWDTPLTLDLPKFLQSVDVEMAGKAAIMARQQGVTVPAVTLDYDPCTYSVDISGVLQRNTQLLMGTVRPAMLQTWDFLASVFLGRDRRMLNFIGECQLGAIALTEPCGAAETVKASGVLARVWPDAPFTLDQSLEPRLTPSVNPDPLLAYIFSLSALTARWRGIVAAMAAGGAAALTTELDIECFYHDIKLKIVAAAVPEQLV